MGGKNSGRKKGSTNKKTVVLRKAPAKPAPITEPVIHNPDAAVDVDKALESLKAEINAETEKSLSEKEQARSVEAQIVQTDQQSQAVENKPDYILDENGLIIEPDFNLKDAIERGKGLQPFVRGGFEAVNFTLSYVMENKAAEFDEEIVKEIVPAVANLTGLWAKDAVKLTQKQDFIWKNSQNVAIAIYLHYKHLKTIKPDPNFGKENANPTSSES